MLGGQFDWGGLLLKGSGFAARYPVASSREPGGGAFVAPRRRKAAGESGCMLGTPSIRQYPNRVTI